MSPAANEKCSGSTVVYSLATEFSLSDNGKNGPFSALTPAVSNALTFTYTPIRTGDITLFTGVSGGTFQLLGHVVPNGATLSCEESLVNVSSSTVCHITPLRDGATVFSLTDQFTVSIR